MKLLSVVLPLLLALQISGFVKDGAAEIIFPEAIRFSVNLTVPANTIASAELTITPEGQSPITIQVDVQQAAQDFTDPQGKLVYLWQIPVANPPPLFGKIAYHWAFTASDGSRAAFDGNFTFADPRVDWAHSVDPQTRFSVAAPTDSGNLTDALQQVHTLLEKNTGQTLNDKLLIYPLNPDCTVSPDDPNKLIATGQDGTVVTCDPGITDAVLAGYHLLIVPADTTAEYFVMNTLVQAAYAPLWNGKAVPDWFTAGLVQFYDPAPKNSLLPIVQQAARSNSLLSLDQMNSGQTTALWQAQSFGMILYLTDTLTPQNVFALAQMNAANFDAAYAAAVGAPLSALIPAWQQWIFTDRAASVYGITPYQPATLTPTITLTATNTATVTPTFTVTPSLTPTATLTPRGFRINYTPPPTVTPSDTFTPPPPSVTPRPPGSMPTPTPIPTALETTAAQPAFQAGVGTFLVLLLALLVFLFFRLGNRR